jgi:membrane protein implicated in regulation of membrane protease activity
MRKFMANMATAKQILWECVELGFVAILAIMLVYLILGQGSGAFVTSVADNVTKFASGVPTQSLIGLALVLAVIYLITNRLNRTRESRPSSRQNKESSQ